MKSKTERGKKPPQGHFTPLAQVPPLAFLFSFFVFIQVEFELGALACSNAIRLFEWIAQAKIAGRPLGALVDRSQSFDQGMLQRWAYR